MEVAADNWFLVMIRHSAVAAGCRELALTEPEVAAGLNEAADDHSSAATELLSDWLAGAATPVSNPTTKRSPPVHRSGLSAGGARL